MNSLWAKFLPLLEQRVATLEAAATAVASGILTQDLQAQASAEAHKLAGVLGTFGLHAGTELAREAESVYRGKLAPGQATADHLADIAARLRILLSSRQ
jgi:HPt (histidine-containing phosphotransfer) domain-containing protein